MDRVVLIINPSASYCGECGWGAFPHEESHQTLAGYGAPYDRAGCGVEWNAVGTAYWDFEGLWDSVKEVRPDLEFVEVWQTKQRISYEDLPSA